MKNLLVLLFVFSAFSADAQWCSHHFSFDSDDTSYQARFFIDTANANNTWQIGQPQKTIFNSAYSSPNVIVTDTVNNYPDNDTSSFIIKAHRGVYEPYISLSFSYQLNKDVGDTAFIEVSADSGANWQDLSWGNQLLHNTNGWTDLDFIWPVQLVADSPFTSRDVYFRFSFISDTVSSNKEGWMIDDICILFWFETSVKSIYNNDLIAIYPNPSDGHIQLQRKKETHHASVQISNMAGQKVYGTNVIPADGNIDLNLPGGIYILRYADEEGIAVKKLVIQH